MKIEKKYGIINNETFLEIVNQLRKKTKVSAVSIFSKEGIHTADQSTDYANWAIKHDFSNVVHRNLCLVE